MKWHSGAGGASWHFLLGVLIVMAAGVLGGCPTTDVDESGQDLPVINRAPAFAFRAPTADATVVQGQTLQIRWYGVDLDDDATIELYYDRDGVADTGDEVLLMTAQENTIGPDGSFPWAVGSLAPGRYHLLAIMDDGVNDPLVAYLPHAVTVEEAAAGLELLQPASALSKKPGESVAVQWRSLGLTSGHTIRVFYDDDRDVTNGVQGTFATIGPPGSSTTDSYTWSVPAVPAGQYYIGATLDDGAHPPVTAYAPGVVAIAAPALSVDAPITDLIVAGAQTVQVRWRDNKAGAQATIRIFYDSDGVANSGDESVLATVQEPASESGGMQAVMLPALAPGRYRIGVVLDDGQGSPIVAYAAGTVQSTGPSLTFGLPSDPVTVSGGKTVSIRWTPTSGSSNATLTLFYDTDQDFSNGIAGQILQRTGVLDPVAATHNWTVPALAAGTYYIGGTLYDGVNTAVAYAPAAVLIGGPTLVFTQPTSGQSVKEGDVLAIGWRADAVSPNTVVTIFYDNDQVHSNGTLGQIAERTGLPTPSGDSASWTVPALRAGTYYIGGTVYDGVNTTVAYSPMPISLLGPVLTLVQPSGVVMRQPGQTLTISWTDDASGNASIRLFFDTDRDPTNGIGTTDPAGNPINGVIVSNIKEDPDGGSNDSYNWQVPLIPIDQYFIGATIDDGLNPSMTVYASGTLEVLGPTIQVNLPNADAVVLPGETVVISWTDSAGIVNADVTIFYDVDGVADSGDEQVILEIKEDLDGVDDTYVWTIPQIEGNSYHIGATINDHYSQPVTAYAAGVLTVPGREFFSVDLATVDAGAGRTFRGVSAGGRLGGRTAQLPWSQTKIDPKDPAGVRRMAQPGVQLNADTWDDLVLVAPMAHSFYTERYNAGEAYVIHMNPALLPPVPEGATLEPIPVWAAGTSTLPGAIFSGPAVVPGGTNMGLGDVAISRDADGDGQPDLLFGIPYAEHLRQEEQDYDPWDLELGAGPFSVTISMSADKAAKYGPPDLYRLPAQGNDGVDTSWDSITAGFVVAVSGANAPLTAAVDASPTQMVIPLDHVGQHASDPHLRVLPDPVGMRFYCPWWLAGNLGRPEFGTYLFGPIAAPSPEDLSRFGTSFVEADLDGDGTPEWIAAQSRAYDGTIDQGWLYVIWTNRSYLWNSDLTQLPVPNLGSVEADIAIIDPDETTTQGGNTILTQTLRVGSVVHGPNESTTTETTATRVTVTDSNGNVTGPTVTTTTNVTVTPNDPIGFPREMDAQIADVFSWPYAIAAGHLALNITWNLAAGDPPVIEVSEDTRRREWVWPMLTDFIEGDTADAAAGDLGGLANVGDFNGDRREDITAGAPLASPGSRANAGAAYLVLGKANFGDASLAQIGQVGPKALAGLKILGDAAGDRLGTSQATAGDFNGDGLRDWVIGAPGYDSQGRTDCGAIAIIFGTTGRQGVYQFSDIGTAKLPGVIITGESAGDAAGTQVAGVGDVDGDGYDDVAVVAANADWTFADGTVRLDCGLVYVIYGGPGYTGAAGVLDLGSAGTSVLPARLCIGALMGNGRVETVAPAGDVDNDGLADILIGAPGSDAENLPDVGEVYLVRGKNRKAP